MVSRPSTAESSLACSTGPCLLCGLAPGRPGETKERANEGGRASSGAWTCARRHHHQVPLRPVESSRGRRKAALPLRGGKRVKDACEAASLETDVAN